jgi:integrase
MASIAKRSNRKWRARYRCSDPRCGRDGEHEHARHFRRKTDGERWLDEVTAAQVTGQYVSPDAGKITLREYAEGWRAAQIVRPSTAEQYESILRNHVYPALGDRPLAAILPTEIQAWVKGLTLALAPSTTRKTHGILASIFRAAVRDRRVVASPCDGTKLPDDVRSEVVPPETEQVRALEEAMPAHLRAFVTVDAATGLRQGELLGLTVDRSGLQPPSTQPCLTVDRQLVTVIGEAPFLGPPKTSASRRTVPLPRVAVDALATHLAAFPPEPQEIVVRDAAGRTRTDTVRLVFTDERSRPYRRTRFAELWRDAASAANLPRALTPHDLRHYYASLLIRHNLSVKVVQSRLGHATAAETLDTYAHLWPDAEDRTRAAVDAVLGAPADTLRTGEGS